MIEEIAGATPRIHPDCFVHPSAVVAGKVTMEEGCSVWFNAAIRADMAPVIMGRNCNVQDGVVIHVGGDRPSDNLEGAVRLGENVSIGHGAIVHGCHVGDNVLIGMGAIVLSGAVIGDNCIIAAGALVLEGQQIPAGSMVMGVPGKVKRPLREEEIAELPHIASHYAADGRALRLAGRCDDLEGLWAAD